MDYKKYIANKKKWWAEIKSLEQEYNRTGEKIGELIEKQSDISFRVQQLIDKIQTDGEKYDDHCFKSENLDGDFIKASNDLFDSKIGNTPTKNRF